VDHDAARSAVRSDMAALRRAIAAGVRIDGDLNYRAYAVDCIANTNEYLDWLPELTDGPAPDDEKMGLTSQLWWEVALERVGLTPARRLDRKAVASQLRQRGGLHHLNGSVVETSYYILNCCRSNTLSNDAHIAPTVHAAVEWLLSKQERRTGRWPVETPMYSGDPQASEYYTAVPLRALGAYLRRYRPERLLEVALPDWAARRRFKKVIRAGALGSIGILVVVLGLVAPIWWSSVAVVVGGVASIAGIASLALQVWQMHDG
jgi:hypothetical protein